MGFNMSWIFVDGIDMTKVHGKTHIATSPPSSSSTEIR